MHRRDFLKAAVSGIGLIGSGACANLLAGEASKTKAKKKNVIFILIDDMGWTDLGCYGSKFYETPNIDKLAAGGMKFTNAYAASPVCKPTRASIMTGKYPARLNITNYIGHKGPVGALIPPEAEGNLPHDEVTVAEAFKEAGYKTGFFGKWHLGANEEYYPKKHGFDINKGGFFSGRPYTYFSPYRIPTLEDGPKGEYLIDRISHEAVDFIDENSKKPFFLFLSHYGVHTPIQAKPELIAKYKKKAKKLPTPDQRWKFDGETPMLQVQDNPYYAAMVESIDQSIGRVMQKLDELNLTDDTVIFFTSDNGGLSSFKAKQPWHQGPTSNLPLRACKCWSYEGGIREPLIVKYPGVVDEGSVCDEPVISTDFYPTMLETAQLPLRPEQHCDGVSLMPLLKGDTDFERGPIHWHYPHYANGWKPGGAVRKGDFVLIEHFEDNRVELYDLKNDIGQKNDLSDVNRAKRDEMVNLLKTWRKQVDAQMPVPNPDWPKKEAK